MDLERLCREFSESRSIELGPNNSSLSGSSKEYMVIYALEKNKSGLLAIEKKEESNVFAVDTPTFESVTLNISGPYLASYLEQIEGDDDQLASRAYKAFKRRIAETSDESLLSETFYTFSEHSLNNILDKIYPV
tara:strand:+ start:2488 stop:2889 length:402 start_codon:yes stop_codon:yes gene_type:complete